MLNLLRSRLHRPTLLLGVLALFAAPAFSQSTGSFTISAGSVTITSTGSGTIPFTLTSVNGFAGSIVVGCSPPDVAAGVHIPTCGGGPIRLYTLTADEVLTGTLTLNSYGSAEPAAIRPANDPLLALFFTVALLSGLTLRRRSARRLTLPLLLATLIPLSFLAGCSTNPPGFTPGTYNYTVTAQQYGSVTPLERGTNATVTIR